MHDTRRDFFTLLLAVSGSAYLGACGTSAAKSPQDLSDAATTCQTMIAANHGHELQITRDDAVAGAAASSPMTLHIQGTSSHDHTIMLAPADYQRLLAGESVVVTSSSALAHTHVVTLAC